jgi:hypothetical protein
VSVVKKQGNMISLMASEGKLKKRCWLCGVEILEPYVRVCSKCRTMHDLDKQIEHVVSDDE